ncbi:HPr family phosphocarrier protein [Clostridium sp. YIM B02515]|uniref:Phosphocarrier protein HPr n=1 Tax=Clostridium rhizosphaerae TaxID=2803861 RepID=A0ABS1T9A8_9CLOT|nr:HPr family phosphocarrier protein [Clostridium rhizosphaerae]MBL4935941.1 HPr family phosphocarrier protein [Clostridium rhizosphaerae]
MISKQIIVENKTGIHARPAAVFVKTAASFKSNITVSKDGRTGNAKSMINILSLGLTKGCSITISAEGVDEETAVDTLIKLVESKFGEE